MRNGTTEFTEEAFDSLSGNTANLAGQRFEKCSFNRCSLSETTFKGSVFVDCTFTSCDLSNAKVTGASFRNARFVDSKLVGVNWAAATNVSHLEFRKCILNYAVFADRDLRKTIFAECVAREADFTDANLGEASFWETDLLGARFANANLTKADLRGARNYGIHPGENKVKGAKFSLPEALSLLHALGVEVEA